MICAENMQTLRNQMDHHHSDKDIEGYHHQSFKDSLSHAQQIKIHSTKTIFNLSPVNQIIFDQFNLLVTTFTVVGYGANMPSVEHHSDILALFILFGVLLFSSFTG